MSNDVVMEEAWTRDPAPRAEAASETVASGPAIPFQFTGSGGEFFRVWIVNLALSIVTLGIYSAWAKVRTRRYFYGNTLLDGAAFDYTASPLRILKGRLIAFAIIGAYVVLGQLYPLASLPLVVVYWMLFPWLLMKSLAFNAHYSLHRGLRFRFAQDFGDTFVIYGLLPILIPLTLGLYYPFWKRRVAAFYTCKHRYGQTAFSFSAARGAYVKIYLLALLWGALGIGLAFGVVALASGWVVVLMQDLAADGQPAGDPQQMLLFQLVGMGWAAGIYLCLLPAYAWIRAAGDNLRWNNTRLAEHRFESDQRVWPLFGIYLLNILSIIATVGLAIPWAKVRLARYRAEHLHFVPVGPLEGLLAGEGDDTSAAADAFDDLAGFEVGV